MRNLHRWSARAVVIGMFAYLGVCGLGFELFATARRRLVWAVAVGAMVVSAVVIPPIGALWERPTSLRWWFLVHEVAGYVRLASVAFAVVVWATRGRAVGPHEQS